MAAYKPLPAYHNMRGSRSPRAGKFEPPRPPSSNISLTRLVISACSSSIANSMRRSNPWGPGDQNSHAAVQDCRWQPRLRGMSEVLSALFNRCFDHFAPACRNALDVGWYLRYPLSYEHITELLAERGLAVTSLRDPRAIGLALWAVVRPMMIRVGDFLGIMLD